MFSFHAEVIKFIQKTESSIPIRGCLTNKVEFCSNEPQNLGRKCVIFAITGVGSQCFQGNELLYPMDSNH